MFGERWDEVRGYRLHAYADPDPGEKPALVLVHGLGVSTRYLLPTGELLLPKFAVYGPNLPGFGRSERPGAVLGLPELADVLGGWLDVAGVEAPTLVANSFGCQVAVELATRRPERIARLVLVGPTVDREARTAWRQVLGLLRDGLAEPPALAALVVREYFAAGPVRVWRTGQIALDDRIEDKVSRLEVPLLVVVGERDGFVPESWGRELAARAARGRFEAVPGAAHAVNFNSPAALAELVRRFSRRSR